MSDKARPTVEIDEGRSWLRKWGAEHPEGGKQLAYRCSEYAREPFWEFSVWLDWTRFGLGPDVEREYGTASWPDRLHMIVNVGPLSFALMRTWNDPERTRVTPPGAGRA